MSHPYLDLPEAAFWRKAVAEREPLAITGLWQPKFKILPRSPVATYGSCFAQHIGNALQERGFRWLLAESAPAGSDAAVAREFGYGVFSSRTANIYTASLLKQWLQWASGVATPPEEVWRDERGRCFDPFRPNIEPGGFASPEEMRASRMHTLQCFRASVETAHCFVFTLGLTESWFSREAGHEYPMCPGTAAGRFDPDSHHFVNQGYGQVRSALKQAIGLMRSLNPRLKVLLTVSPVPLTATVSGRHVLLATSHSKSILRAVAADVAENVADVDYFPSYELITSPCFKGQFFESNQRQVTPEGVRFVMDSFFKSLQEAGVDVSSGAGGPGRPGKRGDGVKRRRAQLKRLQRERGDVVCEEALLEAFGGKP